MNEKELLSFGFKEYSISQHDRHDRAWQFCQRDSIGKRFFVNIRLWKHNKYNFDDGWDAEVQFDMNGKTTFNVEISARNMTPQEVVKWFDNMWVKMECTYYEK